MKKVIFLDRDGTINIDSGFVHTASNWEFTERAPAALKKLQAAGWALAVVTNQSGVAHGLYTLADIQQVHVHMEKLLAEAGVKLDAIAYCPHAKEAGCGCRKPQTGMARQVEKALGPIDYRKSWMVGDKVKDMEFGKSLGMKTALIRSRYWQEGELTVKPDLIVDSLWEFALEI